MGSIANYKNINSEMSKTNATLKEEVKRLKDENTKIKLESLRERNLIITLKKQIADSQRFQVDHVNALTMEVQSFVCRLNKTFVNKNKEKQIGEQSSTNLSADNSKGSRRMSRSFESPVQRRRSAPQNHEQENGLHTITEEVEQNNEADTTQNTTQTQSIITSQWQSTMENLNSFKNSLLDSDASMSIASNSIDSNKENQSSQSSKELEQTEYFGDLSPTPLNNVLFVTNQRKKQNAINHSNGKIGMSGVVSSTPYKRIANGTNTGQSISTVLSESNVCETETEATHVGNTQSKRIRMTPKSIPTLSNDSTTIGTETKSVEIVKSKRTKKTGKICSNLSNDSTSTASEAETMPIDLSNTRLKRNASPATAFKEPKLNTKLRRPLSMEPKVKAKPKP